MWGVSWWKEGERDHAPSRTQSVVRGAKSKLKSANTHSTVISVKISLKHLSRPGFLPMKYPITRSPSYGAPQDMPRELASISTRISHPPPSLVLSCTLSFPRLSPSHRPILPGLRSLARRLGPSCRLPASPMPGADSLSWPLVRGPTDEWRLTGRSIACALPVSLPLMGPQAGACQSLLPPPPEGKAACPSPSPGA